MGPKSISAALFSSVAIATAALAQVATGTITGTLELEPASWYVMPGEDDTLSGWTRTGNEVNVRIVGFVRRDMPLSAQGALTIDFQTEGNPTELEVGEFTISLTPEDATAEGADYSAGAGNANLRIEAFVIAEDTMSVSGSFSGRLVEGGAQELVLDEDTPAVTVDGNFQATLPRLEAD